MTLDPVARPDRVRAAYVDSDKFMDRVALYAHQEPPVDYPGWALEHIDRELDSAALVLDVGCGPGLYVRRLQARDVRCVGVDLSPGMIREVGGGLVGDAVRLPTRTGCADVALAMHFLYHVPDIDAAVRELARVVAPDGTVLVGTNGQMHHRRVPETLAFAAGVDALQKPGDRFHLDNAVRFLRPHFGVVVEDIVRSQVVLTDPEPFVRFVASCGELYEPLLPPGTDWDALMIEVRRVVTDEIASHGRFEMGTESGVFVCRHPREGT